ncbi:MAG: alanine racemase, partial [Clostridia bacterium]|nr:alanine racemase [Clostridia bacterium]
MQIDYEKINDLTKLYGDAFYLLDSEQFEKNYRELKSAFTDIYPEFNIAYSYKTNYTPKFCKIVDSMGGYAEVVSDMEAEIALRIGVSPKNIIWNGPYKNLEKVKELLLLGATVNIDSIYEVEPILSLADRFPEKILNVGVRCNFVVNDGVVSRFGFDVESEEFEYVLKSLQGKKNINIEGLQCHFATRDLKTWKPRAVGMIDLIDKYGLTPAHIDLGGGLFGKMDDSLKKQFSSYIPAYTEYAEEVATVFANRFTGEYRPQLLIEPGSALVGDCMKFAAKVVNIKNVRGKNIATVLGSIYNINPTLNKKNP